jgi:hypothetical protein
LPRTFIYGGLRDQILPEEGERLFHSKSADLSAVRRWGGSASSSMPMFIP